MPSVKPCSDAGIGSSSPANFKWIFDPPCARLAPRAVTKTQLRHAGCPAPPPQGRYFQTSA
jgi:hypothetical protein